jgi:hypothetical protein
MIRVLGIVLLAAGLAGLALGTFEYTQKKKVLDWGPLKVETQQKESVTIPPLAAGGAVALGLVLTIVASRRR